jgi:hypothetical protein
MKYETQEIGTCGISDTISHSMGNTISKEDNSLKGKTISQHEIAGGDEILSRLGI